MSTEIADLLNPVFNGRLLLAEPLQFFFRMKDLPARSAPLILVIEDHPDGNEALQGVLAREGYSTFGARDGIEGLILSRALQPDLILLGLALPVMDGLEFLAHYQGVIPVIGFCSIRSYLHQALDLGAVGVIEAPMQDDALLEIVGDVLKKDSTSKNLFQNGRSAGRTLSIEQRVSRAAIAPVDRRFLEALVRLFEVDLVTVSVATSMLGGSVQIRECSGPMMEAWSRVSEFEYDSPCQLVFSAKQWLGIRDFSGNPLFHSSRWNAESGLRSYAGVPLMSVVGRCLGTLALHLKRPRIFLHSEKTLLQAFASRIVSGTTGEPHSLEFLQSILPAIHARTAVTGAIPPEMLLTDTSSAA